MNNLDKSSQKKKKKIFYLAILSISPLKVAIILLYLESMAPMGSALDSFSNLDWSNAGEKEENLSLNLARYWKEWGVSQMSSYVDSSFVRTYILHC